MFQSATRLCDDDDHQSSDGDDNDDQGNSSDGENSGVMIDVKMIGKPLIEKSFFQH